MAGKNIKGSAQPEWFVEGLAHVWLPYAQMKTVSPPLAVARTEGCRIVLADVGTGDHAPVMTTTKLHVIMRMPSS